MILCHRIILTGLVLLFRGEKADGFYLPGVSPQSFEEGQDVKLKVNKLTSSKTLFPMDYYHLPFCQPIDGPKMEHENLGEFLAGDRIQSSPYALQMKKDKYCTTLCVSDLGEKEDYQMLSRKFFKTSESDREKKMHGKKNFHAYSHHFNFVSQAIRRGYHHNWIVDNLPAASKSEDRDAVTTSYFSGFPVGFMGIDGTTYINNHANIEISYHPSDTETGKYRVVRFTVEPFSIQHEFKEVDGTIIIDNPLDSCRTDATEHTSFDMKAGSKSQVAYGDVLFTYDVIWKEDLNLKWASRWDIYLSMDDAVDGSVHWSSIAQSMVMVIILTCVVACVFLKNVYRDISRYNKVLTDEEKAEEMDEFGWKLVHADVFRPPSFSPMLLSAAVGSGVQLIFMTALTILFAALGFLNPSFRGALLTSLLLFYSFMGVAAGYISSRLYKTFKGKKWQVCTALTAVGFPSLTFSVFFLVDMVAVAHHSTDAVPFTTMFVLVLLWFGVSVPLVFLGSYFGYKKPTLEYPVVTSSIPREIPEQPWYLGPYVTTFIGGILPYLAAFVELYFILSSMWMGLYYYVFGALSFVFILVILASAEVSILITYFQLCSENYNWWWRSFFNSGSAAFYVFLQSIHYFLSLQYNSFATYILYFGYMSVACVGLCLMLGSVGFFASLLFNKKIFAAVKVD